jgi:hypothetical protein
LRATITPAACAENKRRSYQAYGNHRCRFCGGLNDQARPVPECQPVPAEAACPPKIVDETPVANLADETPITRIAAEPAARIGAQYADELELEELLSDLFGEDEEEEPEPKKRRVVYLEDPPEKRNSVPVYTGRCTRCGGYMLNALERHDGIIDDDVYRCCSCGWRTSKTYEINRALAARGIMP